MSRLAVVCALSLAMVVPGCLQVRPWRAVQPPWTERSVVGASEVRATRVDGAEFVLRDASIDEEAAALRGTHAEGDVVIVPLAGLVRLETRQLERGRLFGNAAISTGVVLVLALVIVGTFGYLAALS